VKCALLPGLRARWQERLFRRAPYGSKGEMVMLARTRWPRLHFRFRQIRNLAVSANAEALQVPQNQHRAILFGQRIQAIGKRMPKDFLIGGKPPRKLWTRNYFDDRNNLRDTMITG
jgi:hypothetical protein